MKSEKFNHSSTPKEITCKSDPNDIRIYINGVLHILLVRSEIVSVQSWYVSKTCLKIEITTKNRDVLLEYNSIEKWTKILTIIDEHL